MNDYTEIKELKDLKRGEFFAINENCSTVYSKDEYIREIKKYACLNNETGNYVNHKGSKRVYIGFTY